MQLGADDVLGLGVESSTQKLNRWVASTIAETKWDPLGHVMHFFPWGEPGTALEGKLPRDWQVSILEEIRYAIGLGWSKIFIDVASGHGIGKSALISFIVTWMILSAHTRGIITANTGNQLATKTMPELNKWYRLHRASHWLEYHATSLRRKVGGQANVERFEDWRVDAIPWVKEKPDAFGGLHNAMGWVLVVFDEASGIHKVIYETIDGALSDSDSFMIWIRFGNPLRNVGEFANIFREAPIKGVYTIRRNIDSRDVEGTDVDYINAKIEANGGEDSDYAKSRWRGVFPSQSDWQLIDTDAVDQSMRGEANCLLTDPIVAGIDFARGGDAYTVLRFRKGKDARTLPSYRWSRDVGKNSMDLAGQIALRLDEVKPHYVLGDVGGVGGPIVDRLGQLGWTVIPVNAAGKSSDKTKWLNKRAEMWCEMRDWLKEGGALPKEDKLRKHLIQQEYELGDDDNVIRLVSKDDMAEEGLESPDEAEALAQTFAFKVPPLSDPKRAAGRRDARQDVRRYNPLSGM